MEKLYEKVVRREWRWANWRDIYPDDYVYKEMSSEQRSVGDVREYVDWRVSVGRRDALDLDTHVIHLDVLPHPYLSHVHPDLRVWCSTCGPTIESWFEHDLLVSELRGVVLYGTSKFKNLNHLRWSRPHNPKVSTCNDFM